ncbi:MAG: VOC family protein [Alphaproteobacteria bacterium]
MAMVMLHHVNIRTAQLDEMSEFYEKVLGLRRGKRPNFMFGGAWHYCGKEAVVHLVESVAQPKTKESQIEHFAFRTNGPMAAFQKRLRRYDAPYEVVSIEDLNMRQINVFDPDGNKIEVQFAGAPDDDLSPFMGSRDAQKRFKLGMKFNETKPMRTSASKSKVSKSNAKLGTPAPMKAPKPRKSARRKPARVAAASVARKAMPARRARAAASSAKGRSPASRKD